MSSIDAGNAGMSRRLARNICEMHDFATAGRISLVACCSAANVLYLLLWTVDHPVESTCQWLLAGRQPTYCTCCCGLSITPSNIHVSEPLIAEPLPSVGEVDQLFQIASHFHSQVVCMYVCIYLFIRHGYTKVYSDNENNCIFGYNIQSNVVMLPVRGSSHHTSP